mmetsp:Transcript_48275/g.94321  ORF Transcript_48275/g.94321 Transcript_48275/m.94321 type:complete len:853 (+) Transcript_48275:439-2997(+)
MDRPTGRPGRSHLRRRNSEAAVVAFPFPVPRIALGRRRRGGDASLLILALLPPFRHALLGVPPCPTSTNGVGPEIPGCGCLVPVDVSECPRYTRIQSCSYIPTFNIICNSQGGYCGTNPFLTNCIRGRYRQMRLCDAVTAYGLCIVEINTEFDGCPNGIPVPCDSTNLKPGELCDGGGTEELGTRSDLNNCGKGDVYEVVQTPSENDIMIRFFNGMVGASSSLENEVKDWWRSSDKEKDICNMKEVTGSKSKNIICEDESIVKILLNDMGIAGGIVNEVMLLPNLKELDVGGNSAMGGEINPALGERLPGLKLNVIGSKFYGKIPETLCGEIQCDRIACPVNTFAKGGASSDEESCNPCEFGFVSYLGSEECFKCSDPTSDCYVLFDYVTPAPTIAPTDSPTLSNLPTPTKETDTKAPVPARVEPEPVIIFPTQKPNDLNVPDSTDPEPPSRPYPNIPAIKEPRMDPMNQGELWGVILGAIGGIIALVSGVLMIILYAFDRPEDKDALRLRLAGNSFIKYFIPVDASHIDSNEHEFNVPPSGQFSKEVKKLGPKRLSTDESGGRSSSRTTSRSSSKSSREDKRKTDSSGPERHGGWAAASPAASPLSSKGRRPSRPGHGDLNLPPPPPRRSTNSSGRGRGGSKVQPSSDTDHRSSYFLSSQDSSRDANHAVSSARGIRASSRIERGLAQTPLSVNGEISPRSSPRSSPRNSPQSQSSFESQTLSADFNRPPPPRARRSTSSGISRDTPLTQSSFEQDHQSDGNHYSHHFRAQASFDRDHPGARSLYARPRHQRSVSTTSPGPSVYDLSMYDYGDDDSIFQSPSTRDDDHLFDEIEVDDEQHVNVIDDHRVEF